MKNRINNTGANKIKAVPFDKETDSERAKSAPPSAVSALEEKGDFKTMNNKTIEEVVKNVLRRMQEAEDKDLDKDGDVDSDDYMKAKDNAIKKNMSESEEEAEEEKKAYEPELEESCKDEEYDDTNESLTIKQALVKRKGNVNSKLMEKWFKIKH